MPIIGMDFFFRIACWDPDPHKRPPFEDILRSLDSIVHSEFTRTPHESFHTLQDNWKVEIEQVLHGLRTKEKVNRKCVVLFPDDFESCCRSCDAGKRS